MAVIPQIALGSVMLITASLLQIWVIGWIVRQFREREIFATAPTVHKTFVLASWVFLPLLLCHTAHIYAWAFMTWALGALSGYEEPIYFSLVTYTTVGYGDVTLSKDFRILGAMASVNGILAFGLTTAFLVGLFSNILESLRQE